MSYSPFAPVNTRSKPLCFLDKDEDNLVAFFIATRLEAIAIREEAIGIREEAITRRIALLISDIFLLAWR